MGKKWDKIFFWDDDGITKSVSFFALTFCILILATSSLTEYYTDYPQIIYITALIQCSILLIIYVYKRRPRKYRTQSSSVNSYFEAFGLYLAVVTWCAFCFVTIQLYDRLLPCFVVVLSTAGLASIFSFIFPGRYSTGRFCVTLMILPIFFWTSGFDNNESYLLMPIVVLYLLVLIKILKTNSEESHLYNYNIISLSNRIAELEKKNEDLQLEILIQNKKERALQKNEERYRTLFLNNPIETIIVDQHGKITDYNNAKARTKGRVPAIGETMYVNYGSKHSNDMFSELIDSIKTGTQKEFPEQKYNKRFLHIKISPFNSGAIITAIDITKRKLAEGRIQTLTREILRIQENERKRIARDLHDSVAQDLSSLRISCETFFDDHHNNIFKIRYKIKEISKVLHGAIHALRDIAYELRPPSLDELGLPITLYRYCEEFSTKSGVEVDFFSAGLEKNLVDPDTEINLYRIVQETLSNIKKHSKARTVSIRLVASYPNIILRVKDNGIGFESGLQASVSSKNKRMGLRSMEERVCLLRGKIEIQSSPGQGTRVLVEVPGLISEEEGRGDLVNERAVEKKTKISVMAN